MTCIVCQSPLPDLAVQYGDNFCCSDHARAYHGHSLPHVTSPGSKREPVAYACLECRAPLDFRTDGCEACTVRFEAREVTA